MNFKTSEFVVGKILEIDFLKDERFTNISVVTVDLKSAEKSINRTRWENFVLNKMEDFTSYLSVFKSEISMKWNDIVRACKSEIILSMEEKLNVLIENGKISKKMVQQIRYDILNIDVYFAFKEMDSEVNSEFLEDSYQLYSHGFIPCGY